MCSFGSPTALPGCLKVLAGDIGLGIKFILLLHEFGVRIPHVQLWESLRVRNYIKGQPLYIYIYIYIYTHVYISPPNFFRLTLNSGLGDTCV